MHRYYLLAFSCENEYLLKTILLPRIIIFTAMRFICILLLSICCYNNAIAREILAHGSTNEFQLAISNHDQGEAEQPVTLRSSMVITRSSVVKKITGVSILPGTVLIPSHAKNMSAPVMSEAGIHVKNYLRHIYPAMHFW